jgi:hypothetical protein
MRLLWEDHVTYTRSVMMFADVLTEGLIQEFPDKLGGVR